MDWEIDSLGIVNVSLIYDHERDSPNRANGHWHFKLEADSDEEVTLILKNFENVWNGRKAIAVSEKTNCLFSEDGKNWSIIPTDFISGNRLRLKVHMSSNQMYLASVEPYRISDLENLLLEIRKNPLVDTANLKRIENLLYQNTWFTEGPAHVTNPSSLGEGLAKRFGIDAFVYELNYEWIAGLKKAPMGKDWELLGKQLTKVFYLYFEKP